MSRAAPHLPKKIYGRQPQWQQTACAEIDTAIGDVPLDGGRLMTTEADPQPTILVKRPLRLHLVTNHCGQRRAHL